MSSDTLSGIAIYEPHLACRSLFWLLNSTDSGHYRLHPCKKTSLQRRTRTIHGKHIPSLQVFFDIILLSIKMRRSIIMCSLFGFIVLHMALYSLNIYLWRRFRVNYPFIFGFKGGKESMGYREFLLFASGISVLTLAAVLSNLDMEMDPGTKSYKTISELVPLGLVTVSLQTSFSLSYIA